MATGNFVRLFGKMEVPTLPQVAVRLLELADAEDVEITEVANVIASDAGLTSKVIRTVNSVQMSLQKQITDIHQAVAFMGIKRIYSLALAYSAVQALPVLHDALGMDDAACQEAYQAADAACTELADLLDVPVPTPLAPLGDLPLTDPVLQKRHQDRTDILQRTTNEDTC